MMAKQATQADQVNASVKIVAHRGYSGRFPENTLLAYQAAYAHGARWMECDIQLTKDLKPIVHHDESLLRMAGVDVDIRHIKAKKLKKYSAHYPENFGTEYIGNPFCTLKQLSAWLKNHTDVHLFVEIKQHSLASFGIQATMKAVFESIKKVSKQCIIISFDPYIVEYAKEVYHLRNGWVIPEWSDDVRQRAERMQPDFMFTSKKIMPENPQDWWQGSPQKPWHWANYNVDKVEELPQWIDKGLTFIETNEVADILKQHNKERYQHG